MKPKPRPAGNKLKIPVFDVDEEDKKEPQKNAAPARKPAAAANSGGGGDQDDFKNRLSAMLMMGPRPQATRAPPPRHTAMASPQELIDARLDMPKIARERGVTTRYDISKYDFDGF